MNISGNLKPYFPGSNLGKCLISQIEAEIMLSDIENGRFVGDPGYAAVTMNSLTHILAYYSEEVVLTGENKSSTLTLSPTMGLEATSLDSVEISHLKKKQFFPFKIDKTIPISEMDFKALSKVIPVGSIKPAMPGAHFVSNYLRLPTPIGFTDILNHGEYTTSPFIPSSSFNTRGEYEISLPEGANFLAVPIGAEVKGVDQSTSKIAIPSPSDPLIWRIPKSNSPVTYSISQVSQDSDFLKIDTKSLTVSNKEKTYWQKALPVPSSLRERINEALKRKNHVEVLNYIASYLGIKDKKTSLTNFVYACNPRFGKFIKNNADDLPLIMSELKAGHCDLLSWYVSGVLRGCGIPSWVATVKVTTKDGEHFNGAYDHSVVVFSDENEKIKYYDPTTNVELDKTYHQEALTSELIDGLENKFCDAESEKDKVSVLREFKETILEPLRAVAEKNSNIRKDFRNLSMSEISSILFQPSSNFNDIIIKVSGHPVSWEKLGDCCKLADIADLVEPFSGSTDYAYDICDLRFLSKLNQQSEREKAARVLQILNANKVFIFNPSIRYLSETEVLNDDLISFRMSFNDEMNNYQVKLFSIEDFLTDLASSIEEDLYRFPNYRDHIDGINLKSFRQEGFELVSNYNYSDCFKDLLSKNLFISELSNERAFFKGPNKILEKALNFKEIKKLPRDQINFLFEHQLACFNVEYKKALIEKLGVNEKVFKNFCVMLLNEEGKKRFRGQSDFLRPIKENKISKQIEALFDLAYIDESNQGNLRRQTLEILNDLNRTGNRGHVEARDEFREYIQGDDMRLIDWNIFARTGKPFVKQVPYKILDVCSPVHVIFEFSASSYESFQIREIVKTLQENVKIKKREIYVAFNDTDYFKLPIGLSAEYILKSLTNPSPHKRSNLIPDLSNGKIPSNILFVSSDYQKISAFNYLYSKQTNLRTIHLHDDRFAVYPLFKDSWVENGSIVTKASL